MSTVVVRYRTRPEAADENERLIRAVFSELHATAPDGISYVAYRLEDGLSFVHIATIEGDGNPLLALESFRRFSSTAGERCEEGPTVSAATIVGSY